jgi:hypothetical protein
MCVTSAACRATPVSTSLSLACGCWDACKVLCCRKSFALLRLLYPLKGSSVLRQLGVLARVHSFLLLPMLLMPKSFARRPGN